MSGCTRISIFASFAATGVTQRVGFGVVEQYAVPEGPGVV